MGLFFPFKTNRFRHLNIVASPRGAPPEPWPHFPFQDPMPAALRGLKKEAKAREQSKVAKDPVLPGLHLPPQVFFATCHPSTQSHIYSGLDGGHCFFCHQRIIFNPSKETQNSSSISLYCWWFFFDVQRLWRRKTTIVPRSAAEDGGAARRTAPTDRKG